MKINNICIIAIVHQLDLDNVWNFMFGVPANHTLSSFASRINLCPEAMVTLLAMVRTMLNSHSNK